MHGNHTQFIRISQKQIFPPPPFPLLVSLLTDVPPFVCVSPPRDNLYKLYFVD